jgi:hypothetical protein
MDKIVIAVDFDGTLCVNEFPDIGEVLVRYVSGMRWCPAEFLQKLDRDDFYIIIHTCRANPELNEGARRDYVREMENWLAANSIPYDEVWHGVGKPIASIYLDDRGYSPTARFDNIPLPYLGSPMYRRSL